jgi:hypothetical protein
LTITKQNGVIEAVVAILAGKGYDSNEIKLRLTE